MFLTGGTGLVGSHFASVLRTAGVPVRALHRPTSNSDHLRGLGCELVEGDLDHAGDWLRRAMAGCEAVVHAAALTYAALSWPRVRAVNVEGTRKVLVAAAAVGIARAVHVSSVAVYGDVEGPIDEDSNLDSELQPRETYARSKRESEQIVREVSEEAGLAATILRPAAVYGERDRVLVPKIVKSLRLPLHPQLGGGRVNLAAVYAGNLAHAAIVALREPVPLGARAYNVADDHPVTQRALCSRLCACLGVPFRPVSIPASLILGLAGLGEALGVTLPDAGGLSLRRAAGLAVRPNPYRLSWIRTELGWKPVVTLDEALGRTAESIL